MEHCVRKFQRKELGIELEVQGGVGRFKENNNTNSSGEE